MGYPYKVSKDGTRVECIHKYHDYIIKKINNSDFEELKIKIGCWCKPEKMSWRYSY